MPPRHSCVRILVAAAALLLWGCQHRQAPHPGVERTHIVYVVRRSWHIDIGFPASELGPSLAQLGAQFPLMKTVQLGFGDRRYLLSRQHGAGTLLSALWPGQGLILVTALTTSPREAFDEASVIELHVNSDQSLQIQQFIRQAMSDKEGPASPLAPGPYAGSLFYAATPRYSALHTCNTWAAEALQSAQLPVHSTGVEFAGQLWSQAKRLEKTQVTDTVQ